MVAPFGPPPEGAGGAEDPAAGSRWAAQRALELVREWLAEPRLVASRLVLVTSGAVDPVEDGPAGGAGPGERVPAHAAVWGLVRSAERENPGRFALIDVDDHADSWRALPSLLAAPAPETAVRRGTAYAPRLVRVDGTPQEGRPRRRLDPDGTVLVTGGTGSLGMLVARHLVTAHGVRHLLLVGRRGPDAPGVRELAAELGEAGARVVVRAVDVADRTALATLLDSVPADRPLTGVVHTAAVLDDGIVPALTADRMERVLRPKADAALALHELTRGRDLAMFVLFSSVAGTFGSAGQANYAAANCVVDALARHRGRLGLPGTSIAWGPWQQSDGMTAHLGDTDRRRMARSGFTPLGAEEGLALFDAAVAGGDPVVVAARFDTAVLGAGEPAERPHRTPGTSGDRFPRLLAAASPEERGALLLDEVRARAASVLGHPEGAGAIDGDGLLAELGLDSLAAVDLRNLLAASTGLTLPSTLLFDFPTPRAVAAELAKRYTRETAPGPSSDAGEHPGPLGRGGDPAGSATTDEAPGGRSETACPKGPLPAADRAPDSLGELFRTACARGRTWDGMVLLTIAARLRPVFDDAGAAGAALTPLTLAPGGAGVARLICFPALSALSGPQEYARFGSGLRDLRPVSAVRYPGFGAGEALPGTLDAFVTAQTAAVRALAGGEAPVLLGRSA
ncbi:SDR family NAD(P)-dependent oxidoreductase, partial [Streptomyces sp. NPDC004976]